MHGGLGLHLVALIADAHRGEVFAVDRAAHVSRSRDVVEPDVRPGARPGDALSSAGSTRVIIGFHLPIERAGEGREPRAGRS